MNLKIILTAIIAGIIALVMTISWSIKIAMDKSNSAEKQKQPAEQLRNGIQYRTRPIWIAPPNELVSYPVEVTYEDKETLTFKINTEIKEKGALRWSNKPTSNSYTLFFKQGTGTWHQSYPTYSGELKIVGYETSNGQWTQIRIDQLDSSGRPLSKFALEKL